MSESFIIRNFGYWLLKSFLLKSFMEWLGLLVTLKVSIQEVFSLRKHMSHDRTPRLHQLLGDYLALTSDYQEALDHYTQALR